VISGLALLYSTCISSDSTAIFWRQVIFLFFGILGFIFFSFYDYHTLAKDNKIVYIVLVAILLYLLVFGSIVRGGKRWLSLGFFNFQAAEFVKISVILGLARLMYIKRGQINSFKTLLWSFAYALIPTLLVVLEPDLGSALVIMGLWVGIIFLSPLNKKFVALLFIFFLILGGATWKFFLKPFQKDRIIVFIDPSLDPKGKGYNVRQAAIAIGSGKLFGRGLGKGLQGQNKFLPEEQTDFIFAASSEDIGFVGTGCLVILYFYLFWRLFKIMRRAKDDLGMYISGGVLFFFFYHSVINIGMNIGILPVTGIPLPLLSAGGSSLLVSLSALGMAQNVGVQSKILRF
jgi:rod shape determining protein RodA